MTAGIDLCAILLIGLMVGNEFAVAAFVHPVLNSLELYPHLAAAKRIAHRLGRVMPFWYAACLLVLILETWLHRSQSGSFRLLLSAAILWAGTIVLTVTVLVPRNNRIAALDLHRPYEHWKQDRDQWDRLHRVRVLLLVLAFVLLVSGLRRQPIGAFPLPSDSAAASSSSPV